MNLVKNFTLLLAAVLGLATPASADEFKCVDASGGTSYQATSCPASRQSAPIDRRYSNTLPLGLTGEEARAVSHVEAVQARIRAERARRLRRTLQELAKKRQQCESLKAEYQRVQIRHRFHAGANPVSDADLVRRMRKACSD